jgi:hypothetical protein
MEADSKHREYLWQLKPPLYERHSVPNFFVGVGVLFGSVESMTVCIKFQSKTSSGVEYWNGADKYRYYIPYILTPYLSGSSKRDVV